MPGVAAGPGRPCKLDAVSTIPSESPRRVIPRWREFATAATTGELKPLPVRDPAPLAEGRDDELRQRVDEWVAHPTVGHAADVVSTAFVLDLPLPARAAAEFLVRRREEAGVAAVALAELVLASPPEGVRTHPVDDTPGASPWPEVPTGGITGPTARADAVSVLVGARRFPAPPAALAPVPPDVVARITQLRARLRGDPRNALAWVDLSRLYACVGQAAQAERAITTALALAPEHRFTLRSAARYFLHARDPERAHEVLRRSGAVAGDPWLVAAELAVATVAERAPRHTRTARAMLASRQFAAFDTAELAGAVATLEINAGKTRVARHLMLDALRDPTDNAVAQAEWAARKLRLIELPPAALEVPRTFEARAFAAYGAERWEEAFAASGQWLDDEPFSSRAVGLGTVLAGVGLGRMAQAVAIARRGVLANPDEALMRLNLVYALAEADHLEAAFAEFRRVDASALTGADAVTYLANAGLLLYRFSAVLPDGASLRDTARARYAEAAERARSLRPPGLETLVHAYWAGEEVRTGTPDPEIVARGLAGAAKWNAADLALAKTRVRRLQEAARERTEDTAGAPGADPVPATEASSAPAGNGT